MCLNVINRSVAIRHLAIDATNRMKLRDGDIRTAPQFARSHPFFLLSSEVRAMSDVVAVHVDHLECVGSDVDDLRLLVAPM
jgi:hypothetical protein